MTDHIDDVGLKRLRLRSWRRGMKEMDLILGPFADEALAELPAEELADYERLLSENDQDLYSWVTGGRDAPREWRRLIGRIRVFHRMT
jgi:antitoxin CptB